MNEEKTTLPLLDYAASTTPDFDLSNTLLITCQHILKDHLVLFDYLFEQGLKPTNVYLLGKLYSTNGDIAELLRKRGVFVHPASEGYDSHVPFDEHHSAAASGLFDEVERRVSYDDYGQVMIVDDGAQVLLEAAKRLQRVKHVVAVEWTSAGYHRLNNTNAHFPIVNMARSQAKLTLETPFIAEKTIKELKQYMVQENLSVGNILVVGGGYVGANIASLLKADFEVKRYDIVSQKSDFNDEALHTLLGKYDAIIGSTGNTIITPEHFSLLKEDVVLASSSSSDREFSAVDLRRQLPKNTDPHLNLMSSGIRLMNSGFPITFDGSSTPIPMEKIQLTMALTFVSMAQAQKEKRAGLVELSADKQQQIIDKFVGLTYV